jgi:hypothetical protein
VVLAAVSVAVVPAVSPVLGLKPVDAASDAGLAGEAVGGEGDGASSVAASVLSSGAAAVSSSGGSGVGEGGGGVGAVIVAGGGDTGLAMAGGGDGVVVGGGGGVAAGGLAGGSSAGSGSAFAVAGSTAQAWHKLHQLRGCTGSYWLLC